MINSQNITVAIPTFNRCELLKRAVNSVLKQEIDGLSVIISDNASSDGTKEYLKSICDSRVTVIYSQHNDGMMANWQRCFERSNGKYFLLMSDDDAFYCDKALSKLVSAFENSKDEGIGVVFSDVFLERPSISAIKRTHYSSVSNKAEDLIADFFDNKVSVFPCATLLRSADLRRLGGYTSFSAKLAIDACAWISIALLYGKVAYIDEPLAIYRIHDSLSSSSIKTSIQDLDSIKNLIEQNRSRLTSVGYKKISVAINNAKNRVPIGYITKRWRNDTQFRIKNLIEVLLVNKDLVIKKSNLIFLFNYIKEILNKKRDR